MLRIYMADIIQKLRGFQDIIGVKAKKINYISEKLYNIAYSFNCHPMILPILEYTNLFKRSIGESDVVNKEMFSFMDDNDNVCLRPEMTSGALRAFLQESPSFNRLVGIGTNFRRERPQKGRYRQFQQLDIEFFSEREIQAEFDILLFIKKIIDEFNLQNTTLYVNTIGHKKERQFFSEVLKQYFTTHYDSLSTNAQNTYNRGNYLRILDSKEDEDIIYNAPSLHTYLSESSKKKFQDIIYFGEQIGLNIQTKHTLVRGLDYYNDFVFELISNDFSGTQNAILGGGRFDGLAEVLGYAPMCAIGFAMGIERLMEVMNINQPTYVKIGIIHLKTDYLEHIQNELRSFAQVQLLGDKMLQGLKTANKYKFDYIVIIGDEIKYEQVTVKNMNSGTQNIMHITQLKSIIKTLS